MNHAKLQFELWSHEYFIIDDITILLSIKITAVLRLENKDKAKKKFFWFFFKWKLEKRYRCCYVLFSIFKILVVSQYQFKQRVYCFNHNAFLHSEINSKQVFISKCTSTCTNTILQPCALCLQSLVLISGSKLILHYCRNNDSHQVLQFITMM